MSNSYSIKEKIVRAGQSRVFNNWHERGGISLDDFLDGLKWLCDDPMPDGRMTRELGCDIAEDLDEVYAATAPIPVHGVGTLVRLRRVYFDDGQFACFADESGRTWHTSINRASINVKDRI